MPISKLDAVPALVLIDLQRGIVGLPTAHPAGEIVARSASLAKAFRARGFPVVLVNVTGAAPGRTDAGWPKMQLPPNWTELVAELDQQPGDILISKQRWGAFLGTSLADQLEARGVTQIVLGGVATSIGVESTARSAFDLGYNVVLVTDAMTDRSEESHRHSVEAIFPRLGETTATANVLKLLEQPMD
jgi:nicotinamidase-related amidase